MELIQGSETSSNYNLTPGKYPEENIQYSNHGESLKSRKIKVHFSLEQDTKTQGASRCELNSFFNFGVRCGGWSAPGLGRFTTWKDPVPFV